MKYLLVVQLYGNLSITTATSEINETVESMSRFLTTNRNIELLEPYEGKLSRTVLRGGAGSNAILLPDQTLENKQKFISQIMTSKSPVRSCDDVDDVHGRAWNQELCRAERKGRWNF